MSFKYGDAEVEVNGRIFNGYDEPALRALASLLPGITLFDLVVTEDVRPERAGEFWLNALLRRE